MPYSRRPTIKRWWNFSRTPFGHHNHHCLGGGSFIDVKTNGRKLEDEEGISTASKCLSKGYVRIAQGTQSFRGGLTLLMADPLAARTPWHDALGGTRHHFRGVPAQGSDSPQEETAGTFSQVPGWVFLMKVNVTRDGQELFRNKDGLKRCNGSVQQGLRFCSKGHHHEL